MTNLDFIKTKIYFIGLHVAPGLGIVPFKYCLQGTQRGWKGILLKIGQIPTCFKNRIVNVWLPGAGRQVVTFFPFRM